MGEYLDEVAALPEMLKHQAKLFYYATRKLYGLQRQVAKAMKERGVVSLPNHEEATATRKLVERIEHEAERLQLTRVLDRLSDFNTDDELLRPLAGEAFTLQHLYFQLEELHKDLQRVLAENKFMMIPAGEAGYYDNPALFGSEVAAKFPNANKEIMEAGNCYATGSYTASVFHLMRAVEHGVRALIVTFKIKFKRRPKNGVELKQWGEILVAIHDKITEIEKRKKTRPRDEQLEFLRDAAAQFKYFKDKWRNYVMHTRASYEVSDARKTLHYVEEFMKHLATRIAEK